MSEMHAFWQGVLHELSGFRADLAKSAATNIVGTSKVEPMQAKLREVAPAISNTIKINGHQQVKSPIAPKG